jgi:hypothetical protein
MESVGTCDRCGQQVCETCRTRWRGRIWCAACVNRALEADQDAPQQARVHARQAFLALALGAGVWVVSLFALLLLQFEIRRTGIRQVWEGSAGTIFLVGLVVVSNILIAAVGVGQALAALRTGGHRVTLAMIGLVLAGLYVGALLGLGVLGLSHQ